MTQPHCSDRTDSPSLSLSELLCMLQQMYINTGKSICSLMLIYARTALPRQPLWPAHMNNFNAKGFTLPTDFTVVKYVVESWQLRSLSLTAPPSPKLMRQELKSPSSKNFHSSSDHPTLKPQRPTCDLNQGAASIESEISASAFGVRLLICGKVSGDQRIFICGHKWWSEYTGCSARIPLFL